MVSNELPKNSPDLKVFKNKLFSFYKNLIIKDYPVLSIYEVEPGDKFCEANGEEWYYNTSSICSLDIIIGIYDNIELKILSMYHEVGHHMNKTRWDKLGWATSYHIEESAWEYGFELAHKHSINWSHNALRWAENQLDTYKNLEKIEWYNMIDDPGLYYYNTIFRYVDNKVKAINYE